ncbi:Beta-monoglucosyldiacylglycerol synthase [Roseovarius albus]|uniref:Beta-monoglucosyldiacylglycerol synthase n=2 Tax=Roseovarius albus TaxID=1247867 RepID=A0A1X6ZGR4_9RHOB|nr:Beta-monoglucosyldiacylglycerol synthase [Roseovarius albus]
MGISELRQLDTPMVEGEDQRARFEQALTDCAGLSEKDLSLARIVGRYCDASLDRILMAEDLATQDDLLRAHARQFRSRTLQKQDLKTLPFRDMGLPPQDMLKHAMFPLTDQDQKPALACGDIEGLQCIQDRLAIDPQTSRILPATRNDVQNRIVSLFKDALTDAAAKRVALHESSRSWADRRGLRIAVAMGVMTLIIAAAFWAPTATFCAFMLWAAFTLIVSATLKASAFVASLVAPTSQERRAEGEGRQPLPKVSILVPLFRETEIAHALVARLSQLTYPKCLLDVVLVLEEEDETTQATLAAIDLPPWMRAIVVPDGQPRTKPRAMNYALDFCEGEIIGVFDAEDAPDPDQITTIARRFQQAPSNVACLQGVLDHYNARQNWLSRCFTIEYASWFRLILPGMARLGFAIPLGGTTLYFRREALEELGAWDAHNVTEDADLGFRLARHGYETEMIKTVTQEEANCRPWAWIKQRSRWLKGYMTTYLVHMRRPGVLYRQLGRWKFWGFQAHFISALSQFLLAPFLWSFWLVVFGLPHPLQGVVSPTVLTLFASLFLSIELLNITIHASSVSGPRHRHLMLWAPTMHFYTPLGAIAAYKALYELIFKPFYWDKTAHGLSLGKETTDRSDDATHLARIELEASHKGL